MSHLTSNANYQSFTLNKDPYLFNFYTSILTTFALIIFCAVLLIVKLPNFFIFSIFGFIVASISLSGMQETKLEKFEAAFFLLILTFIGFIGIDICAQSFILAITWILIFTFCAYLFAINKKLRRIYLAPVVAFLPIMFHMRYLNGIGTDLANNAQVIFNDLISIIIVFIIVFIFVALYPCRYQARIIISALQATHIIRNLLKHFHTASQQEDLNNLYIYVEKLKNNITYLHNKTNENIYLKNYSLAYCSLLQELSITLLFSSDNEHIPQRIFDLYATMVNNIIGLKHIEIPNIDELTQQYQLNKGQACILSQINQYLEHINNIYPQFIKLYKKYV